MTQPSGLTVDGIAVPAEIEAEGPTAIAMYVAEEQALAESAVPTSPTVPTTAEGDES